MASVVLPKIPSFLETHHLTMLSLVWCALVVAFSYLAQEDVRWLWGVSSMIALQYVTDFFDGKVGKYRDTGLVKWGFYMDHLLDYVFLCSLVIGYAFVLPVGSLYYLLLTLAVFGGFMVNSFLSFGATGKFNISHLRFGPTEFRIALIIINSLLVLFGLKHMTKVLPYVPVFALLGLSIVVYRTHKKIWRIDMALKEGMKDERVGTKEKKLVR